MHGFDLLLSINCDISGFEIIVGPIYFIQPFVLPYRMPEIIYNFDPQTGDFTHTIRTMILN
jgi:hypothetical protein